jgi:putative DNA primase/helicase
MNAQALTAALNGRWRASSGMACCPAHDDKNPSLQISDGEKAILLKCHAGCETGAVIDALKLLGLWPGKTSGATYYKRPETPIQSRQNDDTDRRSKIAKNIWKRTLAVPGTPVSAYLASRGIVSVIPKTIRYIEGAKHSNTGLYLPCMVCAVTRWPNRDVIAVHRTFLAATGLAKAPVTNNKKMLGPVNGGAVRLAPHGPKLIVCEGIETGLTLLQETGLPVWCALSTSGIVNLVLPDDVSEVVIAADHDRAGLNAANKAAHKWTLEGRTVRIAKPPVEGWDFNDMSTAPDNLAYLRREVAHG